MYREDKINYLYNHDHFDVLKGFTVDIYHFSPRIFSGSPED